MASSNFNHLMLASASDDVKIWESLNFHVAHEFSTHLAPSFRSIHWSSDFQQLVSVPSSGSTLIFTLVKSQSLQHLEIDTKVLNTVARFSTISSRFIGIGTKTGDVLIWDIKYAKPKKTFKCPTGEITCLQLNWNDSYIASGSVHGDVVLHNTTTGQSSSPLRAPNIQGISDLRYSFSKKGLIGCTSDDGTVVLWDANVRQMYRSFPSSHHAPSTGLAFSPANSLLLTSVGLDKKIICYDTQSNEIVRSLNCESPLTSIDFKEDGVTIAAGSSRGKIYIYDLRSPSLPVHMLSAHCSSVQCVAFQNTLVSAAIKKDPLKAVSSKADLNSRVEEPVKLKKSAKGNTIDIDSAATVAVRQIHNMVHSQLLSVKKNLESEIYMPAMGAKKDTVCSTVLMQEVPEIKRGSLTDEIFSPVKVEMETFTPKISPLVISRLGSSPGENAVNANSLNSNAALLLKGQNSSLGDLFSPVKNDREDDFSLKSHITVRADKHSASPILNSRNIGAIAENTECNQHPILSDAPEPVNKSDTCAKFESFPFEFIGDSLFLPKVNNADAVIVPYQPNEMKIAGVLKTPVVQKEIPQAMDIDALQDTFVMESKSEDISTDFNKSNISDPMVDEGRGCSEPATPMAPQAFQAEFIRQIVEDAMDECRHEFRQTFLHYYAQMVKQFEKQKAEINTLLQRHSINDQLITEIEKLREENKLLRATF